MSQQENMNNDVINLKLSDIPVSHSEYGIRYTSHQLSNGVIFHVEKRRNKSVWISATMNNTLLRGSRGFSNIIGFRGIRGDKMYIQDVHNNIYTAYIIDNFIVVPAPQKMQDPIPVIFHISSGPYRAVREGSHLRIFRIHFKPAAVPLLIINDLDAVKDGHVADRSVVYRGFLILFFVGEKNQCKRSLERVIEVESPLLAHLDTNRPFSDFVFCQDDDEFVYLLVPACQILLIIDPGNLKISERQLSFDNLDDVIGSPMNLVGVYADVLSVGVQKISFVSGKLVINGYRILTGAIPSTSRDSVSSDTIEDSICDRSPWNIDVPEFVPNNIHVSPKSNETDENTNLREENARLNRIIEEMKEKRSKRLDCGTQTDENEMDRLREENKGLRKENERLEKKLEAEKWKVEWFRLQRPQ